MALESWRVNEPWPVPASRISRGSEGMEDGSEGGETWMSRRETMRLASAG